MSMKVDIIQTSFTGGEFGPSLYGRTDIAQYSNACKIVENFLIRPYGPAISAPGTRYVATVSNSNLATRVIPFVFNREDSYIIEMGDVYMRFFTDRGQVVTPGSSEDLSVISNLIAQWKCNDNAATTTVTDFLGTYSGTASTLTSSMSTTGIINQAFNLNGLYNISVADNINFTRTASSQPMSIVGWGYYSNNGSSQCFFSKWDSSGQREYMLFVDSTDKLNFNVFDQDTNGRNAWISDSALSTGWHLLAMTFQGDGTSANDVQLYIDGVLASSTFSNAAAGFVKMKDGTSPVRIGARMNVTADLLWGNKVDNIAFFQKKLTSTEILSLYTSTVYQITTVYLENEIFDVKFAQLNDVIWLAHPDHVPQKLVRSAENSWAISNFAFLGGPFMDDNTNTAITITASATTGTVNLTVSPTNSNLFTRSGGTLGHHNSYWKIGGLAQTNTTTGLQEEGYVQITYVTNSYTATATVIKNLKTSSATSNWAEGAWSAVRGYPSSVVFHERRLWWGGTSAEPQKLWASKVFEYDNYALDTQADDDALNLALASNESNEIQWLASGKSLIAGTFGGGFVINSKSTDPITPSNVNAAEEVGYGTASISPKKMGSFLYFFQRFGKKLREMFYSFDNDTYKAVDRTILSPHILEDGIVDSDSVHNPDTVLHCVLSSGHIASYTREVDQEVSGWSRITTAGTFTSIAVIPSQSEDYDEAWVVVERWINGSRKKYIEYFDNVIVPDRQDQCNYLHSTLSYDAYENSTLSNATISLSGSTGTVTVTSSTAYFVGANVNKRIRAIDAGGNTIGEGTITATSSTTSITLSITTTFNALSYSAGRWGVSASSVSGLSHLEAKTVGILADGNTESLTRTVASGVVTLGGNYFVINVGLSYNQVLYTLPKEAGTQRGTAQGKLQRFNEVAFKVNRSTQHFYYGPDSSNLDLVSVGITPSVNTLYTGIIGNLAFRGGYTRGAPIYIKNPNPLPIELLSVIGTLETFEK